MKACKSEAAYYFMPDFEIVRQGLIARKKKANGEVMSRSMLEEADVAVRYYNLFFIQLLDYAEILPPKYFEVRLS